MTEVSFYNNLCNNSDGRVKCRGSPKFNGRWYTEGLLWTVDIIFGLSTHSTDTLDWRLMINIVVVISALLLYVLGTGEEIFFLNPAGM